MPQYRKKPLVVDAIQFDTPQTTFGPGVPQWLYDALQDETVLTLPGGMVYVRPTPGQMRPIAQGDWIIRGASGEVYAIADDAFAANYESAED
ncbi:hypothetical protein NPA31_011860 [Aurantimonas sp. MSK8Z-1]|uniref:hypothetical protein n=1 Tax=Mangrovibrevibacter kandeliae TaxID=2968473 RepID=UPI002118D38E|nr:hypothetical protein [Aurantimonas sp. MSK8Z-1]MCW4115659.1 hypothetical protein [Aurantimonas sp. MSK8Z-1]